MGAYIKMIDVYFPEGILTNDDLSKIYPEWSSEKILEKTGVGRRHVASQSETAVDLAVGAANKLFEQDKNIKDKIDFVILCTQSPDYYLPTSACIIQEMLGLPDTVGAFDFNLGCSGYVYGLSIAKGLIYASVAQNVLLLTSETYSKYINPMDKSTRTIFGDGASATWISNVTGTDNCFDLEIDDFSVGTDGSGYDKLIVTTGMHRHRARNTVQCNDAGAIDEIHMNGAEIFNFTIKRIPKLVYNLLEKSNLEQKDIDYFVFHQANKFMLEHLRDKLNIDKDKFILSLKEYGNTVSSSIPIALFDMEKRKTLKTANRIMLVGFGVGLSWAACTLHAMPRHNLKT